MTRKVSAEVEDRKSGSAGMPRPISYAVFCLKKKKTDRSNRSCEITQYLTHISPLTFNLCLTHNAHHQYLHSFPTRRSSDLTPEAASVTTLEISFAVAPI